MHPLDRIQADLALYYAPSDEPRYRGTPVSSPRRHWSFNPQRRALRVLNRRDKRHEELLLLAKVFYVMVRQSGEAISYTPEPPRTQRTARYESIADQL